VGAELGVRQRRHIDVRDGAEELHGLSGAPEGTVQDLLGRAESDDRLIGQAHQVDQGLERLGTVLARERTHLLECVAAPGGIARDARFELGRAAEGVALTGWG
jgi:hypothetical protein